MCRFVSFVSDGQLLSDMLSLANCLGRANPTYIAIHDLANEIVPDFGFVWDVDRRVP